MANDLGVVSQQLFSTVGTTLRALKEYRNAPESHRSLSSDFDFISNACPSNFKGLNLFV